MSSGMTAEPLNDQEDNLPLCYASDEFVAAVKKSFVDSTLTQQGNKHYKTSPGSPFSNRSRSSSGRTFLEQGKGSSEGAEHKGVSSSSKKVDDR